MILDVHRQALFVGAHGRSLRHRPALQHAVELQTQVVVEPARRVLVDDEPVARAGAGAAERFRRLRGIALAPVLVEAAAARHGAPAPRRARPSGWPPRATRSMAGSCRPARMPTASG